MPTGGSLIDWFAFAKDRIRADGLIVNAVFLPPSIDEFQPALSMTSAKISKVHACDLDFELQRRPYTSLSSNNNSCFDMSRLNRRTTFSPAAARCPSLGRMGGLCWVSLGLLEKHLETGQRPP